MSKRWTYTCARQHDDILGLLQEPHSVFDSVVLRKLWSPSELSRQCDCQQRMIGLVRRALEECRWHDSKCRTELLSRHGLPRDSLFHKGRFAYIMKALPKGDSLF